MSGGYFGDFEAGIQSKGGDVERGGGASKVGPYLIKVHFSTQYSVIGNISIILLKFFSFRHRETQSRSTN